MTHPGGHKKPRTTSEEVEASLVWIEVSVHYSTLTLRQRLGRSGICGWWWGVGEGLGPLAASPPGSLAVYQTAVRENIRSG